MTQGKGLFKSLYKTKGLFTALFSDRGSSPPTKRMDIRLGEAEENPSFFNQEVLGIPAWLLGVFLLGFSFMYRKKKKNI